MVEKDRALSELGLLADRENRQRLKTTSETSRVCRLTPIVTQHKLAEEASGQRSAGRCSVNFSLVLRTYQVNS